MNSLANSLFQDQINQETISLCTQGVTALTGPNRPTARYRAPSYPIGCYRAPSCPIEHYRAPSCPIGRYRAPSCPIGCYRADMPISASYECCRHVATLWYIDLSPQHCFCRYATSCLVFLSLLVCGIESVVPLYLSCPLGSVQATYAP